jgi:DNA ligase (NAD+)
MAPAPEPALASARGGSGGSGGLLRITPALVARLRADLDGTLGALPTAHVAAIVARAHAAYHRGDAGAQFLTDAEFDAAQDHLAARDPQHAQLRRVGAGPRRGDGRKTTLPFYMGSISKIKGSDAKSLGAFVERFEGTSDPGAAAVAATAGFTLTDKLDGVSALLCVFAPAAPPPSGSDPVTRGTGDSDGEGPRVALYSRGDGTVGQDISHLLSLVRGVPPPGGLVRQLLQEDGDGGSDAGGGQSGQSKGDHHSPAGVVALAVRGELIVPRADFAARLAGRAANARNLVSGLVNAARPDPTTVGFVRFVAYSQVWPPAPHDAATFARLARLGFEVVHHEPLGAEAARRPEALSAALRRRRAESPFEVDGVVVCHVGLHALERGANPSYAFAYKSLEVQETAEVAVTGVAWAPSKDGYLAPVVEFEPVRLAGVTVRRASGFNAEFIAAHGLGPGATALVTRSGDVIPHIVRVLAPAPAGPALPPAGAAHWDAGGKHLVLVAPGDDRAVRARRIENFFRRLDVPGVRAGAVARLFDAGLDSLPKILAASEADVAAVPGFQDRSAARLVGAVRARLRALTAAELMDASNAFGRGFARKRLAALAAALPRLAGAGKEDDDVYAPSLEELLAVPGVSDKTARAFLAGLPPYRAFVAELGGHVHVGHAQPAAAANRQQGGESDADGDGPQKQQGAQQPLRGTRVVFTGFRDAALRARVERLGGAVHDAVGSGAGGGDTVLVAKDPGAASAKLARARERGVRIESLAAFVAGLPREQP